jgi:hypothetical protein
MRANEINDVKCYLTRFLSKVIWKEKIEKKNISLEKK